MIICPIPFSNSFGGRDNAGASYVIQALQCTGENVQAIPNDIKCVQKFLKNNLLGSIKAVSAPNAGYLLQCNQKTKNIFYVLKRTLNKCEALGENIFKKYKIKTILLWDDPLGQFTNEIINTFEKYNKNRKGVLKTLKNYFCDWPCVHISWDSGHMDWVKQLKIVEENKIKYNPLLFPYDFENKNEKRICEWNLSFVGNLYTNTIKNDKYFSQPRLVDACEFIKQEVLPFSKNERISIIKNAYKEFINKSSKIPEDECFFWNFYRNINWAFINTIRRQEILEGISTEIYYFGNFADQNSRFLLKKNIIFKKNADYFTELPEVYEKSRITLDIVNSLSINGINGKFYECFAANGFMLLDAKKDLDLILGKELAAKISYSSLEDCQNKVNYFLKNEKEREDLRQEIKRIVIKNHSPRKWAASILSYN